MTVARRGEEGEGRRDCDSLCSELRRPLLYGDMWVEESDGGRELSDSVRNGSRGGGGGSQLTEGAWVGVVDRASGLTAEHSGADD